MSTEVNKTPSLSSADLCDQAVMQRGMYEEGEDSLSGFETRVGNILAV